jgi:hypothetical protein
MKSNLSRWKVDVSPQGGDLSKWYLSHNISMHVQYLLELVSSSVAYVHVPLCTNKRIGYSRVILTFKVQKLCITYIIRILNSFGDSYTTTIMYMINHILAQTSYYSTHHKNVTKTNHDPNLIPFCPSNPEPSPLETLDFNFFCQMSHQNTSSFRTINKNIKF